MEPRVIVLFEAQNKSDLLEVWIYGTSSQIVFKEAGTTTEGHSSFAWKRATTRKNTATTTAFDYLIFLKFLFCPGGSGSVYREKKIDTLTILSFITQL